MSYPTASDFVAEKRRQLEQRLSWQSGVSFMAASDELIAAAREWLCDCFGDQIDEIEEAPAQTIARNVERFWDGGAKGFILCHFDDLNG